MKFNHLSHISVNCWCLYHLAEGSLHFIFIWIPSPRLSLILWGWLRDYHFITNLYFVSLLSYELLTTSFDQYEVVFFKLQLFWNAIYFSRNFQSSWLSRISFMLVDYCHFVQVVTLLLSVVWKNLVTDLEVLNLNWLHGLGMLIEFGHKLVFSEATWLFLQVAFVS